MDWKIKKYHLPVSLKNFECSSFTSWPVIEPKNESMSSKKFFNKPAQKRNGRKRTEIAEKNNKRRGVTALNPTARQPLNFITSGFSVLSENICVYIKVLLD